MSNEVLKRCIAAFKVVKEAGAWPTAASELSLAVSDPEVLVGYLVMSSTTKAGGPDLYVEEIDHKLVFQSIDDVIAKLQEVLKNPLTCLSRSHDADDSLSTDVSLHQYETLLNIIVRLYLNVFTQNESEKSREALDKMFFTNSHKKPVLDVLDDRAGYRLRNSNFKNLSTKGLRKHDIRFTHRIAVHESTIDTIDRPQSPLEGVLELVTDKTAIPDFSKNPQNLINLLVAASGRLGAVCDKNMEQRVILMQWVQRTILRNLRILDFHRSSLDFGGMDEVPEGSTPIDLETFLSKFFTRAHEVEAESFQQRCFIGVFNALAEKGITFSVDILISEMRVCTSEENKAKLAETFLKFVDPAMVTPASQRAILNEINWSIISRYSVPHLRRALVSIYSDLNIETVEDRAKLLELYANKPELQKFVTDAQEYIETARGEGGTTKPIKLEYVQQMRDFVLESQIAFFRGRGHGVRSYTSQGLRFHLKTQIPEKFDRAVALIGVKSHRVRDLKNRIADDSSVLDEVPWFAGEGDVLRYGETGSCASAGAGAGAGGPGTMNVANPVRITTEELKRKADAANERVLKLIAASKP